jgi:hypothetical protein
MTLLVEDEALLKALYPLSLWNMGELLYEELK